MHSSSRRSNQVVSARAVALGAIAALLLASPLAADEPDTAPPPGVARSTMTLERLVTAIRHAQGAAAHGIAQTRREQWKISFGALTGTLTYVQAGKNYRPTKHSDPTRRRGDSGAVERGT